MWVSGGAFPVVLLPVRLCLEHRGSLQSSESRKIMNVYLYMGAVLLICLNLLFFFLIHIMVWYLCFWLCVVCCTFDVLFLNYIWLLFPLIPVFIPFLWYLFVSSYKLKCKEAIRIYSFSTEAGFIRSQRLHRHESKSQWNQTWKKVMWQ